MKLRLSLLAVLSASLLLGACGGSALTKKDLAPKIYASPPVSILVLPPMNKTTAADAKDYYTVTVADPFTNDGYYVYPTEVVQDILNQEGLSDTETMLSVPPQKFREFFGADAVLYVTILEWDTHYAVVAGDVTVRIACELKSAHDGEKLWSYNARAVIDTSSGGGSGLAGLIASVAATAVKTAATDYIPAAKMANWKIVSTLPFGKYHTRFGKDKDDRVRKEEKVD